MDVKYCERVKGKALFASKDYSKDEIIYVLDGPIRNIADRYSIEIGVDLHITDKFGVYMNHSFQPSTKIVGKNVIAVKDIKSGDELHFNYNDSETTMAYPFTILEGYVGGKSRRAIKKVLGIGTALVDIIGKVNESSLTKLGLSKGAMTLINPSDIPFIREEISDPIITSGGSVCNTIYEIARSGYPACFFGKISNDEYGDSFYQDLNKSGITFSGQKGDYSISTGCCHVLVTSDGERTMATYIGIGSQLEPSDIQDDTFDNIGHVYLETYLWEHPLSRETLIEVGELSKKGDFELSISLSDPLCVTRNRDSLLKFITQYIDLVFCNYEEAVALSKKIEITDIKEFMHNLNIKMVMTHGSLGVYYFDKNDDLYLESNLVENVLDTTGAGDNFVAGFLIEYLQGHTILDALKSGHNRASQVIVKMGPRL